MVGKIAKYIVFCVCRRSYLIWSPVKYQVFVVVLTLTHRHYTMQSMVAGQAPITLEWEKYLGKTKTSEEQYT